MNTMLTDDDLTHLLGEAAGAFPVPEQGPHYVLEELGDVEPGKPWLRRRGVQLTAVAAALLVVAVVAQSAGLSDTTLNKQSASSGGPSGIPSSNHNFAGSGGDLSRTGGAAGVGGTSGGGASFGAVSDAPRALAPVPIQAPAAGSAGTTSARTGALTAAKSAPNAPAAPKAAVDVGGGDSPRVVKTGSISLVVDNNKVTATVDKLQLVAQQARGYISNQQTQEFGDSPSATVTMRLPVASFDGVLLQIRSKGFGAKVVSAESSGRDVTAQYADTEAQIVSLRAARARFLTILSGARTIGETLTVQQRVDDVQGQIDRLEGARRVLASQSDYATLTVTVGQKADAILKTTEPSGLSKAWKDAKHGFSSGVNGLIARSGRALLVLLVFAAVLVLGRLGWRLARRRMV